MLNSKQQIRERVRQARERLSGREVNYNSSLICEKLQAFPLFVDAKIIGGFSAIRNEVNLRTVLEEAMKRKKVSFPVVNKDRGELEFYVVQDYHSLRPRSYGILEPDPENAERVEENDVDLIIVPGIAFDEKGNRIGYGKGYYDKFLRGIKAIKVGIAYEFQMIPLLPAEEHDLSMDFIITNERIISCKK